MKLDKITEKMSEALSEAGKIAENNKNPEITEEHLIFAILNQVDGMVTILLSKMGLEQI